MEKREEGGVVGQDEGEYAAAAAFSSSVRASVILCVVELSFS